MTSRTSSVDFGMISNDESLTDFELMEKMHKIEELRKRKEKERKVDPEENVRAYRASHFFCGKTVIPRKFEAEIIKHKSQCLKCSSEIAEREAQKQAWVDALAEMRGVLSNIEEGKTTIEDQKRKILRETKDKLQGWDTVVQMAEHKIKEAERIIQREQIHKHKMLNPDLNNLSETISEAVNDMYLQYERLPPQKKKHFENYISYKSFSE